MSNPSPSSSTVKAASLGDNSAVIFKEFGGIVFVSVFDCVYERFVESDEEIRALGLNQTELRDAFLKIFENAIHQTQVAGKFKFDLFVDVRKDVLVVDVAEFMREGLLDDLAQLVAVVRRAQVVCRAHLESFDDSRTSCTARREE